MMSLLDPSIKSRLQSEADTLPARLCYVDGKWTASENWFLKHSPVNGHPIARVAEADKNLIDRAVAAAQHSLKGSWGVMPVAERVRMLRAVADGIEHRLDDFVTAEVADTGRPVAQARTLDIARGAANFRLFADLTATAGGECFETDTPDGTGALNYTIRRPLGVVAVISPWNLPLLLLSWKVAPALAMGNAVVAKPSEETPSSATLLAEVIHDAGFPAGAFNLIHGHGPNAAGEWLTRHPGVNAITFIGETQTGVRIMAAAAEGVRPVSFELGGKNAALVFADADFDKVVEGVARSTFLNCGQVCLCTERIYVERSIFDRFVTALKARAQALRPGDPGEVDSTLGPLISLEHRDKVMAYFRLAAEEGADVITGGGIPRFGDERDGGAWIEPTLWTGLPQHARCLQEEIFGPVAHIAPFDSEEEAIRLANDSRYGLAASIWTRDVSRAHRLPRQIEAGLVWVNTWFLRDLRTPFGGVRLSGLGREGGQHSLAFYSEPRNVCVKL